MSAIPGIRSVESSPLDAVAREHILERLRRAIELCEQNAAGRLQELRGLLDEAADHADAWQLVRQQAPPRAVSSRVSRPAAAVLGKAGVEPVREFLLIPVGSVQVDRAVSGASFVFTPRHAESAKRWFDRLGRTLAIDYEHQSLTAGAGRSDGLRPAAGWVGGLEVRPDGLWAVDVTWTPKAAELLRTGEYRYFSPVIYWTDEDHSDVAGLGPVALTNDPAMAGVQPLAAGRRGAGASNADAADDVAGATGADKPLDASVQNEGEDAVVMPPASEVVLANKLDAARREIALLQRKLELQEADAFVERGLRLGKILDSTSMDWREDYMSDPQRAEQRLARAPVLLPPGRLVAGESGGVRTGRTGTAAESGTELNARWGIQREDLAAYERAAAAGRVRLSAG
ncbi:MAG: hypothetical protein HRF50_14625 [Phycisphaerae bacterium]